MERIANFTITAIVFFIIGVLITKGCSKPIEKEVIKKEVVTIKVTDTLRMITPISTPRLVFVERVVIENDTIIRFVKEPTETSIVANKYSETLKGEHGEVDIDVTTTGELLDLRGVMRFNRTETTITKLVRKNTLFIGGEYGTNGIIESKVHLNLKDRMLFSGGVGLDNNQVFYKVGVAIPLF